MTVDGLLTDYLAGAPAPLVIADGTTSGFADSLAVPAGIEIRAAVPGWSFEKAPEVRTLVLAVPSRAALRRIAPLLTGIGVKRNFALYLASADAPVVVVPRPEWPALTSLSCSVGPAGDALTVLRLAEPTPGRAVFAELARRATWYAARGTGALVVGDDPLAVVEDAEVPPDVLLVADGTVLPVHPVLGRAPITVAASGLREPVDELVVNPIGYRSDPDGGVAGLEVTAGGFRIGSVEVGPDLRDTDVRRLRSLIGVTIDWPADTVPGLTRLTAALAMAGVPVGTAGEVPGWAAADLGALAPLVARPLDFATQLLRDEQSVRLRRAAFADHSTFAWRRTLAARAGVAGPEHPAVSVLLVTRRPEMLEHALAQVGRQRGLSFELFLATHGFTAEPARVRDALPDVGVVHLDFPVDAVFGDVLTAAARAASGEVLVKLDDDDWYGPDALTDLLLARHYSGAPLVGMPAEFAYLEPLDTTIRRSDRTEFHAQFVAGGTMMVDRGLLASLGWFRSVRKYVDKQLLVAVQATGASIYRTHGLGYVMRRTAGGHTWDAGIDYFLDESRVGTSYPGFAPSALLE